MAQAEQKTSYEKVKAAASAFAAYLEVTALPVHYIQVRLPDYPIRRVDHETGLSPYRETQVKSTFTWSEAQRRWTRKDGGILVAETEIWHVIQYFIQATVQDSAIDLCNIIDEQVEGIYHGDVDKAWRLWQDSGLSRAEFSQNVRWVGRIPLKLPGPYGRPPSTARMNFSSAISSSTARYGSRDKQLSRGPSDVQKGPTPYFHPNRPKLLYVGRSRKGGNTVWVTIVGSEQQQLRYLNHTLEVVSVKDLNVVWHPHLELDVFQGRHEKEKERTRRQHIIKLIEDNTRNTSNPSEDTSRPDTPTPMSLRPRPSTCKRRRTNMGTIIDDLKSDGLSDSDSFPSPSKLIDLCGGRRLKKACDKEVLPLLRVSSVETKRASAYDVQPGKSGRTSGHTINHATGARMNDYATSDHIVDHATNACMIDHATHDHTINHATNACMIDHATHDHTVNHATNTRMIDHATHDHTVNHATNTRMIDHATHDHIVDHATNACMIDHATHDHTVNHATEPRMIDYATSSLIDRVEGQTVPFKGVIRTILRVSTSNKPAKAPMNILLGACMDIDEFYSKVLSQCITSADEVPELSAVFTWNGRGNLIRKGNHDDWSFFYEDLQRSWKRDIDNFTDGTCEIEIMLHMEN